MRAMLAGMLALGLLLVAGCKSDPYEPKMKDPKQQEKDGKAMMEDMD